MRETKKITKSNHTPSLLSYKHNVTPWAMVVGHVMLVDLENSAHPRTIPYTQPKAYDRKNGQKRGKKKGKKEEKRKEGGKREKEGGFHYYIGGVRERGGKGGV